MGTCRPPSLPHVRTPSMQHAHARVDAPAHTHIFFVIFFCATGIFFVDGTEMEGKAEGTAVVVHCLSGMSQKLGSDLIRT